jgi:hypothetical protein
MSLIIVKDSPVVVQTDNVNNVVTESASNSTVVVSGLIGPAGPAGIQGPVGPAGPAGSDLHYTHEQMVPSSTWTINHNLGKFASIQVFDSGGAEVEGSITQVSTTSITVTFSAAFSGVAYVN